MQTHLQEEVQQGKESICYALCDLRKGEGKVSKYRVTFYLLNNRSVSCDIDDLEQLRRMIAAGRPVSFFDDDGVDNIIPAHAIAYLKILKI